jgi:hypothetical protein
MARHALEGGGRFRPRRQSTPTAARRASETLAFDRAARLYLLALDLSENAEPEARRGLQISLGDALANAGRGAEAASSYLAASRGAGKAETLELQRRAAEQLLLSGHIDQSVPVLRSVLANLGFGISATSVAPVVPVSQNQIRLRGLKFREQDHAVAPGAADPDRHLLVIVVRRA